MEGEERERRGNLRSGKERGIDKSSKYDRSGTPAGLMLPIQPPTIDYQATELHWVVVTIFSILDFSVVILTMQQTTRFRKLIINLYLKHNQLLILPYDHEHHSEISLNH